MKNLKVLILLLLFVLGMFLLENIPPERASAQLVMVDKVVKITKVDIQRSRLEVGTTSKGDETMMYVLVDGFTKVTHDGNPISWKQLRKGQLIRVVGGLTFELRISAKKIMVVQ